MNDGSIGSTFNEGMMKVEGETAYCIDINTDFKNGYKTRADARDVYKRQTLCEQTLENACKAYPMLRGAILHSDRGTDVYKRQP